MTLDQWLPAALRAVGLSVTECAGWRDRSHGALPDDPDVVQHHDASPAGDSPGALGWMLDNWNTASAQIWIDNYGGVFLVGAGVAYHAGRTAAGTTDNADSVGIETDHTVGEAWPEDQLSALRLVSAVILAHGRKDAGSLWFHSTIAVPAGRKRDPDGLVLDDERRAVAAIIATLNAPAPTVPATPEPSTPGDDDMALNDEILAELKGIRAELASLNATALAELRNAQDTRLFSRQIRDNASRIASGAAVVKVAGKVTS